MSLYQKYRPKDFNSLCGQEFVKISLQNALIQNKTVWAYLFYGSRWTGKTTVARIMAKWFNCLDLTKDWNPCLVCNNCVAYENWELLDIIEIDAASNTWVDNIRELIEKAQFQPNQARFKVYIIDEVHMLSKWAFNALLKTLEEPPSHVKFILATTEIHKIPDTIISRTQRYDFKKISENDIIGRLLFVAENENISVEKEALELIARLSRWWLRDALTLFEQYSIWGKLLLSYLMENLQLVGDEFLDIFVHNLVKKDKTIVLENLDFLREKNIDVKVFIEEISFYIRDKIFQNIDANIEDYLELFSVFGEIYAKLKFVPNTFILFEMEIVKFLNSWNIQEKIVIEPQKSLTTNFTQPKKADSKIEDFNVEKITNTSKVQNSKDTDLEDIFADKKDLLEEEVFSPSNELPTVSEPLIPKVRDSKEVILEKQINENEKEFDLNVLFDSIKQDSGRGFVLMSLKNARNDYKNWVFTIRPKTEFDLWKLNNPEIKSYIQEKIEKLFLINEVDVQIER